jgi:hypothetical protein
MLESGTSSTPVGINFAYTQAGNLERNKKDKGIGLTWDEAPMSFTILECIYFVPSFCEDEEPEF